MNIKEYTKFCLDFAQAWWNTKPDTIFATIGLLSEAGEVADLAKKSYIKQIPADRDDIIDECGDCLWHLIVALSSVDSNLQECIDRNVVKLSSRGTIGKNKEVEKKLQKEVHVSL